MGKRKYTAEQVEKFAADRVFKWDPECILFKLGELYTELEHGGEHKPEFGDELALYKTMASLMMNIQNHSLIAGTVSEPYKPFLIKFIDQMITEYNCTTAAERALVQLVAQSFVRIMELSEKFNIACVLNGDDKAHHKEILSKSLDRTHRHFLNALNTLKQMKSPGIKITINTDNANVAQNQQLNVVKEGGHDEIIES